MGILRVKTQDESLKQNFCTSSSIRKTATFCVPDLPSDNLTSSSSTHDEDESSVTTLDSTFNVPVDKECISSQGSSSRSSSTTNIGTSSRSPIVTFDKILIRRYNRIAVDHPCCSSGVPVGLSWEYNPEEIEAKLDSYELRRKGKRRSCKDLKRIPDQTRYFMLVNDFDVPMSEVCKLIKW